MSADPRSEPQKVVWFLEGLDDHGRVVTVPLHELPFRIGRLPGLELTLLSERVSKVQAEISAEGDGLRIRDLGSTNGTFLNRRKINRASPLSDADILHFGDKEFQVCRLVGEAARTMIQGTARMDLDLPTSMLEGRRKLRELLDTEAVKTLFQGIVEIDTGRPVAFEALSRGEMEGLPSSPDQLFELAATVGQAVELSRLMNILSVERFLQRGLEPPLFLNVHPEEVSRSDFLDHLSLLRRRAPELQLVVELPETAITSPSEVRELKETLEELTIDLAYDDFGAGRSRLLELVEAPPKYLKFDQKMIRGLDREPSKRRLVEALLDTTRKLGITTIAEGVETDSEASVCLELGFDYGQGFRFAPPDTFDKTRA